MGFANIGGFIILFFALIILVSMFMLIQGNLVETTTLTYNIQKERMENEIMTSIDILNISLDNTTNPDTTTAYIENTGKNKIDTGYVDFYIDNIKIPRNINNRTISYASGSDSFNPLHWDPDEIIKVEIYLNIQNTTHMLTTTTEHGVKDTILFQG